MLEVTTIGLDIAKNVFHVHGADARGRGVFSKRLSRVDAEAICEAAQRPTMRLVAVKSEEQQASALAFRTRDLLVRQRTQLVNAIRGHLTEYGWVAPKGVSYVSMLGDMLEEEMAASIPVAAVAMFRLMLDLLRFVEAFRTFCAAPAAELPALIAAASR
jgi:transposase